MTMPCRITDERVYNPWEGDCGIKKGLEDITLYDLMADENQVWLGKNDEYGYLMEIENDESTEPYLREVGISPYAVESLASFCRRFLNMYERINLES